MRRRVLIGLAVVAGLWAAATGYVFWIMHKPPEEFAKSFSRLPMASMMVIPFEPMWMRARAGGLEVGEQAPDFDLATMDKSGRVRLSELRGRPVVLVFGSYT
jgi:hypothetical protein